MGFEPTTPGTTNQCSNQLSYSHRYEIANIKFTYKKKHNSIQIFIKFAMMTKTKNKKTLLVEGMSCSNCALGIQKHLISKGFEDVNVSFSTGEVSYSSTIYSEDKVSKIIKKLGYRITGENKKSKYTLQEKLFLFTLLFTIPLLVHMFLPEESFLHIPLIQFLLCTPVYIVGVWYFGKSAWYSIISKSLNMDVLITIGSSAAYLYSTYGWYLYDGTELTQKFLFFETSATIITLVLLGNVLEHRSVKQTTTSIKELSKIQNTIAKIDRNGEILIVDFNKIKVGDILIINSGDKIATDGVILEGFASIDESMITGESISVEKEIGEEVIGGTILISGNIKVKANRVGKDTLLSNIIDLVKDAQNNKPNIQKLGDKISSYFVPIVVFISFITFLLAYFVFKIEIVDSLLRSIAVLVISCPCAMGLATPTAIIVGIGRAAKNGILIKGGNTLEKFASIRHMFFDKTGTITTGNFEIKNFNVFNEDENFVKTIIYNLEKHSSHPIASSLVQELSDYSEKIDLTEITEVKGISISAIYKGDEYKIGSKRILNEVIESSHDLYLLKNDVLISTIDIKDEIKENTNEIIESLNNLDLKCSLISGDKKSKCADISKNLSFQSVYSERLPNQKLKIIEEYNLKYNTAMIGDGINDAPSLSESTIGVSLGGATGVAIESADIILLNKNNLSQLPLAFKISKHTLLTIKQNLFWAFSYNIIAIPIAAFGYLNPMWGALFMAFSDIVVIGNSIRLKYKKLD